LSRGKLEEKQLEENKMLIKLPVILLFICIGIANYYLMKSFWCHEGVWGKDVHEQ